MLQLDRMYQGNLLRKSKPDKVSMVLAAVCVLLVVITITAQIVIALCRK